MTKTLKDYFKRFPQSEEKDEETKEIKKLQSASDAKCVSESPKRIPCFSSKPALEKHSDDCSSDDRSACAQISLKRSPKKTPEKRKKRKHVISSSSSENESETCVKATKLMKRQKRTKKENNKELRQGSSAEPQAYSSNSILKYFSGSPKKIRDIVCPEVCNTAKLCERSDAVDSGSVGNGKSENCEDVTEVLQEGEELPVCKKKLKWSMRVKLNNQESEEMHQKVKISEPDLVCIEEDETQVSPDEDLEECKGDSEESEMSVEENECQEEEVKLRESDNEELVVDVVDEEEKSQSPKLRRSSRVRKPVAKFEIESDQDAEPSPSRRKKKKVGKNDSLTVELDSETSSDEEVKKKPAKKLAPVFVRQKKHVPTAEELARETAKLAFLSSGVPDEVKQHQELIERLENIEYQYVPAISHVQQFDNTSLSWIVPSKKLPFNQRLTPTHLKAPGCRSEYYSSLLHRRGSNLIRRTAYKFEELTWPTLKKTVREFEKNARFPFYQTLYRLSKKISDDGDIPWTEKYKPGSMSDISFNREPIETLFQWGKEWRTSAKKRKDIDSSDTDESDEEGLHGAVLLSGPCGSGKTMGAYVVAEQLGWDFVEVNASSKRSGKHLQLALQEATQSHQMGGENSTERICAVLIEDVDLVFSDDEDGYYSTLINLISSSKRPVVMTTTSDNIDAVMTSLKKRISPIRFTRPSLKDAACFLACVCLTEGVYIPYDLCLLLAENHRGDLRSLLSFAQIWLQSLPSTSSLKTECLSKLSQRRKKEKRQSKTIESSSESEDEDEGVKNKVEIVFHKQGKDELDWDFSEALGIPVSEEYQKVVEPLKDPSGDKWWQKLGSDEKAETVKPPSTPTKINKTELEALETFGSYLENESSLDIIEHEERNALLKPWWKCKSLEGLGDEPVPFRDIQEQFEADDILSEMAKCGRALSVSVCEKKDFTKCEPVYSFGSASGSFFNLMATQRSLDVSLSKQLELTSALQRHALALDYLPSVRTIYKIESARYEGNTKRGRRFQHYARSLGLDLPAESVLQVANCLR